MGTTELKAVGDGVEIWYNGKMAGKIMACTNSAGVQVMSNSPMLPQWHASGMVEIRIAMEREREVEFPPATPLAPPGTFTKEEEPKLPLE